MSSMNSRWMKRAAAVLGWCLTTAAPSHVAAADAPGQVPIETFFRHADIGQARLSPSGRRLAVTVNVQQRVALAVFEIDGSAPSKLIVHYSDADIRRVDWVNDDRLVYSVIDLQSGGGDQRVSTGLFSVAADGSDRRELVRVDRGFERIAANVRDPLNGNHHLLSVPRAPGNDVIVGKYVFAETGEFVEIIPLRLNVVTQQLQSLGKGMPDRANGWLFDGAGEPRVATVRANGQNIVHWRAPGSDAWRVLATMPANAHRWTPHSVDDAGRLYVTVGAGPASVRVLKQFDFTTDKPVGEALVSTPGFDFTGRFVQDVSGPVLGVRVETDAKTTAWFDPKLVRWQAAADAHLPGRVNEITCRRCASDDPVVLVDSWSDRHPGELFTFRPARGEGVWSLVGAARKDVDATKMAAREFFRIKTRDGLDMPAWITRPNAVPGAKPATPHPAVVLVHGGPWVRGGHWAWNDEAQFLASRGYVVIEPEFRGSTGYGYEHFAAGFKQWGRAMQDDVADALQWAVAKGWADKERACIVGASYGGYAALMGPIRDPALYRCAVAWVAVTEPALLYKWYATGNASEDARAYEIPELVGDPVKDADMLNEVSPLAQVVRLKVPVLLAQGGRDRRIPTEHGERMRSAMRAAGNPPEWVSYPDEGHGWLKEANRFDFARRMEAFLAKHLK